MRMSVDNSESKFWTVVDIVERKELRDVVEADDVDNWYVLEDPVTGARSKVLSRDILLVRRHNTCGRVNFKSLKPRGC